MHATTNGLIAQLIRADQTALLRKAQMIQMNAGDVLSSPESLSSQIYFPVRGSIALYVGNQDKASPVGLAVGLIGAEGAVGLQVALGLGAGNFHLLVQSAGEAYVVNGIDAQHLAQQRQQVLLKFSCYLWSVYENIATLASEAYTQNIKTRLAHWLLLSANRCAPDPLELTHTQIAKMLGVRRVSISIAAREMKLMRYISYNRGRINLLNIPALELLSKN